MAKNEFTTNAGDFLVIWITGSLSTYIAQVTQSEPLQMKVEETGPFAHLKAGDFIIREQDTAQLQRDAREDTCAFLEAQRQAGRKVISGLKCLGIKDGKLREILPVPTD